jgi:hypothetical protein
VRRRNASGTWPIASYAARAHEDRVRRAVRRVGRLVHVVEQQHGFAGRRVAQLDPVGKADRRVDRAAPRAVRGERGVGQAEERLERRGREAEDAEGHGVAPMAMAPCCRARPPGAGRFRTRL